LPFVGVDDGRCREEEEEAAPPETMGDAVTCKCLPVSRKNEWGEINREQRTQLHINSNETSTIMCKSREIKRRTLAHIVVGKTVGIDLSHV
jgi:hypothetical protein